MQDRRSRRVPVSLVSPFSKVEPRLCQLQKAAFMGCGTSPMRKVHAIDSVSDVIFLRHNRNFELCTSAPPVTRHRSQDGQTFPTREKNLVGVAWAPFGGAAACFQRRAANVLPHSRASMISHRTDKATVHGASRDSGTLGGLPESLAFRRPPSAFHHRRNDGPQRRPHDAEVGCHCDPTRRRSTISSLKGSQLTDRRRAYHPSRASAATFAPAIYPSAASLPGDPIDATHGPALRPRGYFFAV
jgi:hypothetical protein